ncbi:GNAT family N-acetyltransferase [Marivivens marinus]|uniref:GNAT family N-acetyltransferase n=1 Tax=Marivivens marinus TaxID=3110173 RepID=UPI003B84528A
MADPTRVLRPATVDDLDDLSALCIRSKAHWGYDQAFMAACLPELIVTEDDIDGSRVIVAEVDGVPVAVSQVAFGSGIAELVRLFVDPDALGQGHGAALYQDALEAARAAGAPFLRIESDPFAAPFYERMGAERVGDVASETVAGRRIPLLHHRLDRHRA